MNISISGRIWPAPRHDSDKTRAVVQLEECSLKSASVVLGFALIAFLCSLADL